MDANKKGRQTHDEPCGQVRFYRAQDDSTLSFEPSPEHCVVVWSTKDPAISAIRSLLEREIAEHEFGYGTLMHGPEGPGKLFEKKRGWRKVWDKFSDLAATNPGNVQFVRFDTDDRSIALESLPPRFDVLGIGYLISHKNGKPLAADVEALRRAFAETAADSIKTELEWALEALTS